MHADNQAANWGFGQEKKKKNLICTCMKSTHTSEPISLQEICGAGVGEIMKSFKNHKKYMCIWYVGTGEGWVSFWRKEGF